MRRGKRTEKAVAVATDLLDDAVELARACAAKFNSGLAHLKEGASIAYSTGKLRSEALVCGLKATPLGIRGDWQAP
jgi:hypothetical protein